MTPLSTVREEIGGHGARPRRAAGLALFGVATLLLLALHRPAFEGCYGFLDDYALIDPARRFPDPRFLAWMLTEGRPIYGLLLNAVLLPIKGVCDLAAIRLVNLALVATIAAQCHLLAIRGGWPRTAAAASALLIVALPGFAVAIAWATLIGPLAAIVAGLAAAALATSPDDAPASRGRLAGAVALTVAALAIYQPGAMAFLPGCVIALVRRPMDAATIRRHVVPAAGALLTALGLYGALFVLATALLGGELVSTRAELVVDPLGKARWFLGTALRQALNLFNVEPVPRFGMAVTVLIVAGAWLRQRTIGRTIVALACQGAAVLLSFLPNLTVNESWPAFRSGLPMTMTIAILTAGALVAVAEELPRRLRAPAAAILIGGPALFGLALTAIAAEAGIIRLQKVEWATLLHGVQTAAATPDRPIVMVRAAPQLPPSCAHWQRFDEFGVPSSSRGFAAAGMRRQAWHTVHGTPPPDRFTIVEGPMAARDGPIVIDLAAAVVARADEICGP